MEQQVPRTKWLMGWLLPPMLMAGVCGCGSNATVTGKVSYQGRPVTYGSVIILSADRTARSGVIEPDGSYTVEGVAPGEVRIAVISHDPARGRSVPRGEKPGHPRKKGAAPPKPAVQGWVPLPPRFEDSKTSGLGCTVGTGCNRHDIDLAGNKKP